MTLPVRLAPLTVKVCAAEAVPCVVVKGVKVPEAERDGAGTTVPLTNTDRLAAPALVTVMLPLTEPTTAPAAMRTEIVVAATVPDTGVNTREPA